MYMLCLACQIYQSLLTTMNRMLTSYEFRVHVLCNHSHNHNGSMATTNYKRYI